MYWGTPAECPAWVLTRLLTLDREEPPFVRYPLQHVRPVFSNADVRAD